MPPTASTPAHPPTPSSIHTTWTNALNHPPTTRLSSLRRLLRSILSSSTPRSSASADTIPNLASTSILNRKSLALLYLDLALTYAFLGEYSKAALAFQDAALLDPGNAFAYFGVGLAKAELREWDSAGRNWKRCLSCFERGKRRGCGMLDGITYDLYEGDVGENYMLSGGLGDKWVLERSSVEWNIDVARIESTFKKGFHRWNSHGWNGIPAGLRFGPDWQAVDEVVIDDSSTVPDEFPGTRMCDPTDQKAARCPQSLDDIGKAYTALGFAQGYSLRPLQSAPSASEMPPPLPPRPNSRHLIDEPPVGKNPRRSIVERDEAGFFHPAAQRAEIVEEEITDALSTNLPPSIDIQPAATNPRISLITRDAAGFFLLPPLREEEIPDGHTDEITALQPASTWPTMQAGDETLLIPRLHKPPGTWPLTQRQRLQILMKSLPPTPAGPHTPLSALSLLTASHGGSYYCDSPTLGRYPYGFPVQGSSMSGKRGNERKTSSSWGSGGEGVSLPLVVMSPSAVPSPLDVGFSRRRKSTLGRRESASAAANETDEALELCSGSDRNDDTEKEGEERNSRDAVEQTLEQEHWHGAAAAEDEGDEDEEDPYDHDIVINPAYSALKPSTSTSDPDPGGPILLPLTFEGFGKK